MTKKASSIPDYNFQVYIILNRQIVLCDLKKSRIKSWQRIDCALGNKEFCFWQDKKAENAVFIISDVGTRGIYMTLALGTAKF